MILARLIRFRGDIVTLWHAFWNPLTPTYLKALTLLTVLYVISPFDIVTDIIPVLGLVDDVLIVAFAVNWIVSRLPHNVRNTEQQQQPDSTTKKTINGTARRH
jgi:uncharacterized membrane protein YkvA (DUF1232 family)